jgi:hypothetical protein
MNFQARFTRYSGAQALRQISGIWLVNADNFQQAYDAARLMIEGMTSAGDGEWVYELISLETTSFSGERIPDHGPTIWQGPEAFAKTA